MCREEGIFQLLEDKGCALVQNGVAGRRGALVLFRLGRQPEGGGVGVPQHFANAGGIFTVVTVRIPACPREGAGTKGMMII